MVRIDLHVHTRYSGHSMLWPEKIKRICKKRGLDAIAITDHDEIKGAIEMATLMPTIIGEEVSSKEGDVIGLFLKERIKAKTASEAIDSIRSQGGLVMIPHPFDTLRREAVMSEEICGKADIIEVFNSRVVRKADNERARNFAESRDIPIAVGSDAHTAAEIGRAWMDIDSIDDPKSFMKSLKTARTHVLRSPIYVHMQTKLLKLREVFD